MTLPEFEAILSERIPTPREFVAFATGQGWSFQVEANGKAAIFARDTRDPMIRAFARMLSCEPYRTNVLKVLAELNRPATPAPPPPKGGEPCPNCQRVTDHKKRCWNCCNRPCGMCAKATGSAFIATCDVCAARADKGNA